MSDNNTDNTSENSEDNKVAKRKILPKAQPVLPEVDESDEQIIRTHNPGAALPKPDEDDPDILAAQAELRAAEEKLAKITQDKIILKAVEKGEHLDPDRVEELCEAEPWKKGKLTELAKSHFGFVPEKFEMMAELHPEGSEDHTKYMEARDKAREIYWNQVREDVRRTAGPLNQIGDPLKRRTEYEAVNMKLWRFSNALKKDPLYQNQSARVFWAAEFGMRHHFEKGATNTTHSANGYTRFKASVSEPDNKSFETPPAQDTTSEPLSEKDEKSVKSLIEPEAPSPD